MCNAHFCAFFCLFAVGREQHLNGSLLGVITPALVQNKQACF